jgi:hypothetical protein
VNGEEFVAQNGGEIKTKIRVSGRRTENMTEG